MFLVLTLKLNFSSGRIKVRYLCCVVLALFEAGVGKDNDKGNDSGLHGWDVCDRSFGMVLMKFCFI